MRAPRLSAAVLACPRACNRSGTAGIYPAEGLFPRRAPAHPPGPGLCLVPSRPGTATVSCRATVHTRALHRGTGSARVAVAEGVAEAAVAARL